MQTGENSIIEAHMLYHSNLFTYIVLLFAVKHKFMTLRWIQQLIPLLYLDSSIWSSTF